MLKLRHIDWGLVASWALVIISLTGLTYLWLNNHLYSRRSAVETEQNDGRRTLRQKEVMRDELQVTENSVPQLLFRQRLQCRCIPSSSVRRAIHCSSVTSCGGHHPQSARKSERTLPKLPHRRCVETYTRRSRIRPQPNEISTTGYACVRRVHRMSRQARIYQRWTAVSGLPCRHP